MRYDFQRWRRRPRTANGRGSRSVRTLTAALMASLVTWGALALVEGPYSWALGLAMSAMIGVGSSVRIEFRG
jgi:predicted RND superfamily exporter protein